MEEEEEETMQTAARIALESAPDLREALRALEVRARDVPGLRACGVDDRAVDWARVFLLDRDPLPAAAVRAAATEREEGGVWSGGAGGSVRVRVTMGHLLDVCFGELLR